MNPKTRARILTGVTGVLWFFAGIYGGFFAWDRAFPLGLESPYRWWNFPVASTIIFFAGGSVICGICSMVVAGDKTIFNDFYKHDDDKRDTHQF